jgi:hypothetical protein
VFLVYAVAEKKNYYGRIYWTVQNDGSLKIKMVV